jgi:hypothetical protein
MVYTGLHRGIIWHWIKVVDGRFVCVGQELIEAVYTEILICSAPFFVIPVWGPWRWKDHGPWRSTPFWCAIDSDHSFGGEISIGLTTFYSDSITYAKYLFWQPLLRPTVKANCQCTRLHELLFSRLQLCHEPCASHKQRRLYPVALSFSL